jgi:hypothetical protein
MCLRRAPEKYIAGAALDRADLHTPTQSLPYTLFIIVFASAAVLFWLCVQPPLSDERQNSTITFKVRTHDTALLAL